MKYRRIADQWKSAVEAVLWHDEVGAWLDYDLLNYIKRDYFYPTNVVPLWTNCYDVTRREDYVSKVMKYLEKNQISLHLGGIPTTLEHSGEQWDYPNAWPPLQYFVIMALDNTGDPWAEKYALELSERWVRSNYKAFNETNYMYEKVWKLLFLLVHTNHISSIILQINGETISQKKYSRINVVLVFLKISSYKSTNFSTNSTNRSVDISQMNKKFARPPESHLFDKLSREELLKLYFLFDSL